MAYGTLVVTTALLALLSGCASRVSSSPPSASPPTSAQAECDRTGGAWNANLGICETPPSGYKR